MSHQTAPEAYPLTYYSAGEVMECMERLRRVPCNFNHSYNIVKKWRLKGNLLTVEANIPNDRHTPYQYVAGYVIGLSAHLQRNPPESGSLRAWNQRLVEFSATSLRSALLTRQAYNTAITEASELDDDNEPHLECSTVARLTGQTMPAIHNGLVVTTTINGKPELRVSVAALHETIQWRHMAFSHLTAIEQQALLDN